MPASVNIDLAIDAALDAIAPPGAVVDAVEFGRSLAGADDAVDRLHEHFAGLSPVHALNNLALVVWALCSAGDDFGAALGDTVAAGWDTDCNAATVGGLLGLAGIGIPERWTAPWHGRVGVDLAGHTELSLIDLADRTVAVARRLRETGA